MHQQAQLEAAHGLVEGLIEAVLLLQQCSVDRSHLRLARQSLR
jgi:hypothetical protein